MNKILVDLPKPPFQLYRKKGEEFETTLTKNGGEIWACGECGTLYTPWGNTDQPKERAAQCCLQRYCGCGDKIEKYYIGAKCGGCQRNDGELKRLDKAEEITTYDGPVYDDHSDKYWENVEEFLDWAATEEREDLPEWLLPCQTQGFPMMDASNMLESYLDEFHEDAADQLVDEDELQNFLTKWSEKQTLESWFPDYSRKISVAKLIKEVDGAK